MKMFKIKFIKNYYFFLIRVPFIIVFPSKKSQVHIPIRCICMFIHWPKIWLIVSLLAFSYCIWIWFSFFWLPFSYKTYFLFFHFAFCCYWLNKTIKVNYCLCCILSAAVINFNLIISIMKWLVLSMHKYEYFGLYVCKYISILGPNC